MVDSRLDVPAPMQITFERLTESMLRLDGRELEVGLVCCRRDPYGDAWNMA